MNQVVGQWLRKADADLRSAHVEGAVERDVNYDAVCFFAQQCVEKSMKALLIALNADAPKTHDLGRLSRLIAGVVADWSWDDAELERLTRGAVDFRYPDEAATSADAKDALDVCVRLRAALLGFLPADDGT